MSTTAAVKAKIEALIGNITSLNAALEQAVTDADEQAQLIDEYESDLNDVKTQLRVCRTTSESHLSEVSGLVGTDDSATTEAQGLLARATAATNRKRDQAQTRLKTIYESQSEGSRTVKLDNGVYSKITGGTRRRKMKRRSRRRF